MNPLAIIVLLVGLGTSLSAAGNVHSRPKRPNDYSDDENEYEYRRSKKCLQPIKKGFRCMTSNPQFLFAYEQEIERCVAFRYKGCGGNGNRFTTYEDCMTCAEYSEDV